jgi:predicted RNA-binding protein with EMAP domain
MEIIIILGSLLFISLSALLTLYVRVRELKNNVKKLSVAYLKIESLMSSKTKLDNDAHQESFIKFLSDSRDSAFDYIEEVQSSLFKFVEKIDPDVSYFKEYGDLMAMKPNYDALKNIISAYEDLIKILPKEDSMR